MFLFTGWHYYYKGCNKTVGAGTLTIAGDGGIISK